MDFCPQRWSCLSHLRWRRAPPPMRRCPLPPCCWRSAGAGTATAEPLPPCLQGWPPLFPLTRLLCLPLGSPQQASVLPQLLVQRWWKQLQQQQLRWLMFVQCWLKQLQRQQRLWLMCVQCWCWARPRRRVRRPASAGLPAAAAVLAGQHRPLPSLSVGLSRHLSSSPRRLTGGRPAGPAAGGRGGRRPHTLGCCWRCCCLLQRVL